MRVLLRLCDVQLFERRRGDHSPRESSRGDRGGKATGYGQPSVYSVMVDMALDAARRPPRSTSVERRVGERRARSRASGRAEVEADHAVARPDRSLAPNRCRHDELVGLASLIGAGDCLGARWPRVLGPCHGPAGRTPSGPAPSGDRGPSPSSARPPTRPCVRRPCAHHRLEFEPSGARRRVGSVSRPSVNAWTTTSGAPRSAPIAISARRWPSSSALRHRRPGRADAPAAALRKARRSTGVLVELAIVDGVVDPSEVLAHDAARTEVQMPDLAVAHLPFRQPDGATASDQRGVRKGVPERVEDRGARQRSTALPGPGSAQPPAVEDHEARPVTGMPVGPEVESLICQVPRLDCLARSPAAGSDLRPPR